MSILNTHYGDLKDSYLFADIAKRIRSYQEAHPGERILRLGIGDVTKPLVPSVIQALHEAADDQSKTDTFHGYMPECGDPKLRHVIAERYRKRGVMLEDSEVFVSSGASDELGDILDLFDRSLPAVLLQPVYPAYADANVMAGRKIITIGANEENGFLPEPPAEMMTALIYICSPNNPTGAAYSRKGLQKWVDYANEGGSILLFDAAYEAFVSEPGIPRSIFELPGARTCAVEICSLSKTAGFTGTRLGYTVIPVDLKRDGLSLNAMWVRNRTTKTNGVSYILQKAGLAVFSEEGERETAALLDDYRKNAEIFMRALDEAGIWYTGGKNSPYIWVKCPHRLGSWEYFDFLLNNAQIVGTPGEGFGTCGEGFFRFSMFGSRGDIEEAGRRVIDMKTITE